MFRPSPCASALLPFLVVSLSAAAPALADEATRHAQVIERLAPSQQRVYIERLIAKQRARAAAEFDADTTGPVLTGFNAPPTLNVSKAAAPYKIAVKATDNISGAQELYFSAVGPSGQYLYIYAISSFPATSLSLAGGLSEVSHMLEPGNWKFRQGNGFDGAGNYSYFDESTLDALGNTSFTVVNNGGYDIVKPLLTSGKILTPTVSLSAVLPGTMDKPPYVKVKVSASDAGNGALAGVKSVGLDFCKVAEPSVCLYVYASSYATGLATVSLNLGGQVSASQGHVTGTYELRSASIWDHAGNWSDLQGAAFGGTTDFSALFPEGTTIKLKP